MSEEPRIPEYVSFKEVVDALPFSGPHLRRMIKAGEFPPLVKLGKRRSAFAKAEVLEWLKRKREGAA